MGTTRRVNRERAHGLDGLRGLAALGILVLHVWMYTQANDPTHNVLVDRVIGEFRTGVELFFVLSAFLLAAPWVAASRGDRPAPHLGRFAIRRAARIVPGYLVALIGSLLLLHGTGHPRDIGLGELPLFLLFIPNLVPATRNMLDPPMWTHARRGELLPRPPAHRLGDHAARATLVAERPARPVRRAHRRERRVGRG